MSSNAMQCKAKQSKGSKAKHLIWCAGPGSPKAHQSKVKQAKQSKQSEAKQSIASKANQSKAKQAKQSKQWCPALVFPQVPPGALAPKEIKQIYLTKQSKQSNSSKAKQSQASKAKQAKQSKAKQSKAKQA